MTRAAILGAFAASLTLAIAATAHAQTVRAGVDVAALLSGMDLLEVRAPERAGEAVRLLVAPNGAQSAEVVVDVLVGADAAAAKGELASQLRGVAGDVPQVRLGDEGYADEGFAAFARDNVAIAIRRMAGALDVRRLATRMDAVVTAAPGGSTRASVRAQVPDVSAMARGEVQRVVAPADALAMSVIGSGDVRTRRTREGFVLERTGDGAASVRVIVVDMRLRVGG
jgi:hypothetical protein